LASGVFDALVIGGGIIGLWTGLDLAMRGLRVAVLERGVIGGETSGKFHGLLHSGARYAVRDPVSASECISENRVLSRIASHAIEDTGGYFVALTREDEEYYEELSKALRRIGIPFREVPVEEARREEPELNPGARIVIEVPDKVVYGRDMVVSVALTAFREGALVLEHLEAMEIRSAGEELVVRLQDRLRGDSVELRARAVINAAGPWAGEVAKRAGVRAEVMPTAGTMVVYPRRLTRRVINRMRPPSDGDIVVPYGSSSIAGTTAFIVEDLENVEPVEEEIEFLTREAAAMLPRIAELPVARAYTSIRPLIRIGSEPEKAGREATRSFQVIAHSEPRGFFTVVGGKFTTARLVAEKLGDTVAKYLGVGKRSRTSETPLAGQDPYQELRELKNIDGALLQRVLDSIRGGMDEERGRLAAYAALHYAVTAMSRKALGLPTA